VEEACKRAGKKMKTRMEVNSAVEGGNPGAGQRVYIKTRGKSPVCEYGGRDP